MAGYPVPGLGLTQCFHHATGLARGERRRPGRGRRITVASRINRDQLRVDGIHQIFADP
jgi:hypothetical protein